MRTSDHFPQPAIPLSSSHVPQNYLFHPFQLPDFIGQYLIGTAVNLKKLQRSQCLCSHRCSNTSKWLMKLFPSKHSNIFFLYDNKLLIIVVHVSYGS
jgi:hypothetical protein